MPEGIGPRSVSARDAPELPVLGQPEVRAERADAARNRERVLAAAAELIGRHGVEGLSMDQVAKAAGVGKGTLFRRFGDKAGLAVALLDERERALQQRLLSGPPPLGPGAPAPDRLLAFVDAYLEHVMRNLELVRMSETASPGARYRVGSYRLWHRHVAVLLHEARPDLDADALSHVVLAAAQADLVHCLDEQGRRRHTTAVRTVVQTLTAARTLHEGTSR